MNIHELRVNHEADRSETYAQFARVIREKNLDAGVAIGVAFGGQAETILDESNAGELLGVDPYDPAAVAAGSAMGALNLSAEQLENLFWYMMGRLSRFGPRYNHVRGSSAQAAQILGAVELDFVHLDADRSYHGVWQDLTLWIPRLRGGGIIGGQGYDLAASPGVKPAVDEFFGKLATRVHIEPANVWWVEKHV
ncbi:MAG: hypothetical protein QOE14_980 [Humisphaera sp.]|nr:hypothetical protein [Humisphaera sp.]